MSTELWSTFNSDEKKPQMLPCLVGSELVKIFVFCMLCYIIFPRCWIPPSHCEGTRLPCTSSDWINYESCPHCQVWEWNQHRTDISPPWWHVTELCIIVQRAGESKRETEYRQLWCNRYHHGGSIFKVSLNINKRCIRNSLFGKFILCP